MASQSDAADEYLKNLQDQPSGSAPPESGAGRAAGRSGRGSRSRNRGSAAPTGLFADTTNGVPEDEDKPKVRTAKFKRMHEGVLSIYTGAQMAAMLFDPHASMVIGATKVDAVDAWIDLAEKDTKVADMLNKLTTGSGYGAVVAAHLPMLFPILARRGIIPGGALFDAALFSKYEEPTPYASAEEEALAHMGVSDFPTEGVVFADQSNVNAAADAGI